MIRKQYQVPKDKLAVDLKNELLKFDLPLLNQHHLQLHNLYLKVDSVVFPLPSIVTFLLTAGLIVTLLFGPVPLIGPFNKKPTVSDGATYKVSINSSVTAPAIPSMLSFLNAESILGK